MRSLSRRWLCKANPADEEDGADAGSGNYDEDGLDGVDMHLVILFCMLCQSSLSLAVCLGCRRVLYVGSVSVTS